MIKFSYKITQDIHLIVNKTACYFSFPYTLHPGIKLLYTSCTLTIEMISKASLQNKTNSKNGFTVDTIILVISRIGNYLGQLNKLLV